MKHVDRDELYHSLSARVAYLQDFLDFGSADIEALSSSRKSIKSAIPSIVDKVYAKLLEYDITARVFASRDSRCTIDPEEWPTADGSVIMRRKIFLRWYLTKLNSDPNIAGYWEYLDKVGEMHHGQARLAPLHVDYIFLGACLGFIQNAFTEAVFSLQELDTSQKLRTVQAFGKLIWIQNDLLARWQLRDQKDVTVAGSENESDGGTSQHERGLCPFTDESSSETGTTNDHGVASPQSSKQGHHTRTAQSRLSHSISRSDASVDRSELSRSYRLLRLSQSDRGMAVSQLEEMIQQHSRQIGIANVERLHDGSLELLVRQRSVDAVRKRILTSFPTASLDLDYSPWEPTEEAETYFGRDAASKLHREWTTARAQRLKDAPSHTGDFYRYLFENPPAES